MNWCMILFLDIGWVGGEVLEALDPGWSAGGAADIKSVLSLFFGVWPKLTYLLGVL